MPFQKANKLGRKFQPGQSANPGGRPKKKPLTEALERLIESGYPIETLTPALRTRLGLTDGKPYNGAEVAARFLMLGLRTGRSGVAAIFKEMADRVEGKAAQQVEMIGAGSGPVDLKTTLEICDAALGFDPKRRTKEIQGS